MVHQRLTSKDGEWYTPPYFFEAFNHKFDLDPCSPGVDHWVPARHVYTKEDDGLAQPWFGTVFMNPPYGYPRNSAALWLGKLVTHGDGIGLVSALTSSGWFHQLAPKFDAMLFPKGKTKFIRHGKVAGSPAGGIVLLAIGSTAVNILENCNLGLFLRIPKGGQ